MLNANPESDRPESDDEAVERIVQTAARGALMLVAIATGIMLCVWLAFYVFVFLQRS